MFVRLNQDTPAVVAFQTYVVAGNSMDYTAAASWAEERLLDLRRKQPLPAFREGWVRVELLGKKKHEDDYSSKYRHNTMLRTII
jgi:hypothetical protein